jgi:hypothetical protein
MKLPKCKCLYFFFARTNFFKSSKLTLTPGLCFLLPVMEGLRESCVCVKGQVLAGVQSSLGSAPPGLGHSSHQLFRRKDYPRSPTLAKEHILHQAQRNSANQPQEELDYFLKTQNNESPSKQTQNMQPCKMKLACGSLEAVIS